ARSFGGGSDPGGRGLGGSSFGGGPDGGAAKGSVPPNGTPGVPSWARRRSPSAAALELGAGGGATLWPPPLPAAGAASTGFPPACDPDALAHAEAKAPRAASAREAAASFFFESLCDMRCYRGQCIDLHGSHPPYGFRGSRGGA